MQTFASSRQQLRTHGDATVGELVICEARSYALEHLTQDEVTSMCTVDKTRSPPTRRTLRRTSAIASVVLAVAAAAALTPATGSAQQRGNAQRPVEEGAATLEQLTERVTALERLVASLDTRLAVVQESARPPPEPNGRPAALRIDDLERQMAQLRLDLSRLQTSVDSAARAAENAQRSATQAENTARDALFRASR
jgi:hypothetical protein